MSSVRCPFMFASLSVCLSVHDDVSTMSVVCIASAEDYLALSPLFVDIDLLVPLDAEFYAPSPCIFS